MNLDYDHYFRNMTDSFERPWQPWGTSFRPILKLLPMNWRPDARYFLARNIFEMVIRPYRNVQQKQGLRLQSLPIWDPIVADVESIVQRAEKIAKRRNRAYVSATSVAQALGELAPDLKTTSLQIWGPDE